MSNLLVAKNSEKFPSVSGRVFESCDIATSVMTHSNKCIMTKAESHFTTWPYPSVLHVHV